MPLLAGCLVGWLFSVCLTKEGPKKKEIIIKREVCGSDYDAQIMIICLIYDESQYYGTDLSRVLKRQVVNVFK